MVANPTIAVAASAMSIMSPPHALPSSFTIERAATIAATPGAV